MEAVVWIVTAQSIVTNLVIIFMVNKLGTWLNRRLDSLEDNTTMAKGHQVHGDNGDYK